MAACTGIHVKQMQIGIPHHSQDVRMTADEELGLTAEQFRLCPPVVIARVSSDVCHIDPNAFAIPDEIRGQF